MKTKPKMNPKYLKTTGREIIPAPNIVLPICKKAPKNVVVPLEYFGLIFYFYFFKIKYKYLY